MSLSQLMSLLAEKNIRLELQNDKLSVNAPKGAMTKDILDSLKNYKQEILEGLRASSAKPGQINKQVRSEAMPTSYAQARLLLTVLLSGNSAQFNVPRALKLQGELNIAALQFAFDTLVQRHESIRTNFPDDYQGDTPVQLVTEANQINIPMTDFSELYGQAQSAKLDELLRTEAGKEFDLSRDLMLRVKLIKLAPLEHVVLVTMHHIASDGWSMGILVNEFCALYKSFVANGSALSQDTPLKDLLLQYADYAQWQRDWMSGEVLEEKMSYWRKQLEGLPQTHSLALDNMRPKQQTFAGGIVESNLDIATLDVLKAICQKHESTLFMAVHAAFSVLLARYSDQKDIAVGTPVANREQSEIAGLIGFFVNTLVLRSRLDGEPSFNQILRQSKKTLLDAYEHQQVPFEKIVESLQPNRENSISPLFQIMLVQQNAGDGVLSLPGLEVYELLSGDVKSKYDLTLTIKEHQQGLRLLWNYNADLFNAESIAQMAEVFQHLLSELLSQPEQNVFAVPMLSDTQSDKMQALLAGESKAYQKQRLCHEQVQQLAVLEGQKTAVVHNRDSITYEQLNARAYELAHVLAERGIEAGKFVVLYLEKGFDLLVGMLAVWKVGGVYIPVDPAVRKAQLEYILTDSNAALLITSSSQKADVPGCAQNILLTDELSPSEGQKRSVKPTSSITPDAVAYCIYTSGSTGNPKGVLVTHQNLNEYFSFALDSYYCQQLSGSVSLTSHSFDLSIPALLLPLLRGEQVHLNDHSNEEAGYHFLQTPEAENLLVRLTPSHLRNLLLLSPNAAVDNQHVFVVGGEALSSDLATALQKRFPKSKIYNHYGPTEATIGCTLFDFSHAVHSQKQFVPIGRAMANTQLYVLNETMTPVPQGVVGELYIGGTGVVRGYLNQPQLTQTQFVDNPFGQGLLYRSGDLVICNRDGELEYVGRGDEQIKIRGFRLDKSEIETALLALDCITAAFVDAREHNNDKRLVAWVVCTDQADGWQNRLKNRLTSLPDFMMPSIFVAMADLPLAPSGKLNSKALPEPDFSQLKAVYVAPETNLQLQLCRIWEALLGIDRIGIKDNFFALGGHSMLMVQLLTKIRNAGFSLTVQQLLNAPTIAQLSQQLQDNQADQADQAEQFNVPENLIKADCAAITPELLPLIDLSQAEIDSIVVKVPGGVANVKDIYPLGPLQEGILFHHLIDDETDPYIMPSLFRIDGKAELDSFISALNFIVQRHDILRTAIHWEDLPQPVQVVHKDARLSVKWLTLASAESAKSEMEALCAPEHLSMDLSQAPLLTVKIGQVPDSCVYYFLLTQHHIITDATSHKILSDEAAMYLSGQASALEKVIPYRDYIALAAHQRKTHDAKVWFSKMYGDFTLPSYPLGLQNIKDGSHRNIEKVSLLEADISTRVRQVANDYNVSPATVFHAIWALFISYYSQRQDVVFGTVLSGRLQNKLQSARMPGVFLNTLPLRIKLAELDLQTLLVQTSQSLNQLLSYEQVPLSQVQSLSGLADNKPLFSAMLNYRHSNAELNAETDQNATFQFVSRLERTNYPFTLGVTEYKDSGFGLSLKVDSSVNVDQVMATLNQLITGFVSVVIKQPDSLTDVFLHSCLPTMAAPQKQGERAQFSACNVTEYFDQSVSTLQDSLALLDGEYSLSYAQLNDIVDGIALQLAEQGIKQGDFVGLAIQKGAVLVASMIAVMKLGAAWVPLDPRQPELRNHYIVTDAGVSCILAEKAISDQVAGYLSGNEQCGLFYVDSLNALLSSSKACTQYPALTPEAKDDVAYIIYTSGSTGKPKGVLTSQKNIVNFYHGFLGQLDELDITGNSPWLWNAVYSFDASLTGIVALFSGRPLLIPNQEQEKDPVLITELMAKHKVEVFKGTPKHIENIIDSFTACLPQGINIISGGEDIAQPLWHKICDYCGDKGSKAINAYGPTETTVNSSYAVMDRQDPVNIGSPMVNTRFYILDEQLNEVPQGSDGILYVGGDSVALRYVNAQQQSQQSFIQNPFGESEYPVLYKTGDKVKQLPDGRYVFAGRADNQIKLRGYRIEPEEIQQTLLTLEVVKDAVVSIVVKANGEPALAAWLTVKTKDVDEASIKAELARSLPEFMLPERLMLMDALPLMPSGKLDKKVLPEPFAAVRQQQSTAAADTEEEKLLCQIIADVLKLKEVSVTDNFMKLGGDSILSMQVVTRAKRSGIRVKIKDIFAADSIASLAKKVKLKTAKRSGKKTSKVQAPVQRKPHLPLNIQTQFLDKFVPQDNHFNQSVFVNTPAGLALDALEKITIAMLNKHDMLRAYFAQQKDHSWLVHYGDEATMAYMEYLKVVDMTAVDTTRHEEIIRQQGEAAHQSFDITRAGLFKVLYFDFGPKAPGKLLLLAHHLIVDGVSWRVLLTDLQDAWAQYGQSQTIRIEAPGTSFADWVAFLQQYQNTQEFAQQNAYWQKQAQINSHTVSNENYQNTVAIKSFKRASIQLSKAQTMVLTRVLPQLLETEINDVLLAGLQQALNHTFGQHAYRVMLEGHGREELDQFLDLSDTTGWFTCKYPVVLSAQGKDALQVLCDTKAILREVPNKGLGYGLWKDKVRHTGAAAAQQVQPTEFLFNFLGSFDQTFAAEQEFSIASEYTGDAVHDEFYSEQPLHLKGNIWDGKLNLTLAYNPTALDDDKAQTFVAAYKQSLADFVSYCKSVEDSLLFRKVGETLPQDEIEEILLELNDSQVTSKLFCCPPIDGNSLAYSALAEQLADNAKCYGLNYPGMFTEISIDTIEQLAAFYIGMIKAVQPEGPYHLLGWSSGGTVAWEIAAQLAKAGDSIGYLGVLDQGAVSPQAKQAPDADRPYQVLEGLYRKALPLDWDKLQQESLDNVLVTMVSEARKQNLVTEDISDTMVRRYFHCAHLFSNNLRTYKTTETKLDMDLFRVKTDDNLSELGWESKTEGQVKIIAVPGEHRTMVFSPHVQELAAALKLRLGHSLERPQQSAELGVALEE